MTLEFRKDLMKKFIPSFPLHMVWLATNACNARCLHCSSNSRLKTDDELKTIEVLEMINQFKRVGVIDLGISGGEPLLRSDLYEIISYAVKNGFKVGVGSNGAKLTETQATRLKNLGINRLQLSLDGFETSHDMLRKWPGLFKRVKKSINIAQNANLRVHVCFTINQFNFHEIEAFTKQMHELGVKRINFSRYIPTGRGTDFLDLSKTEWKSTIIRIEHLKQIFAKKIEIVSHHPQEILFNQNLKSLVGFNGCQAGINQGCITANGTVYPCVLLPVPIGNIRKDSFEDIWKNSLMIKSLKQRFDLKGKCRVCQYKYLCGGCRALAFSKTSDYLAEDPRCWLGESETVRKITENDKKLNLIEIQ